MFNLNKCTKTKLKPTLIFSELLVCVCVCVCVYCCAQHSTEQFW